jgi:hypothetical protein
MPRSCTWNAPANNLSAWSAGGPGRDRVTGDRCCAAAGRVASAVTPAPPGQAAADRPVTECRYTPYRGSSVTQSRGAVTAVTPDPGPRNDACYFPTRPSDRTRQPCRTGARAWAPVGFSGSHGSMPGAHRHQEHRPASAAPRQNGPKPQAAFPRVPAAPPRTGLSLGGVPFRQT